MQNPWDVRLRSKTADSTFEPIFLEVGRCLTAWEVLESYSANLFDAMVAAQPSNRAAHSAFIAVASSSARSQLLEAACDRALPVGDPARSVAINLITQISNFGARRNEIAHGRVYDLGEHGFQLGPNNTTPRKWKDGTAKYQYGSEDLRYYANQFADLGRQVHTLTQELIARDIAARNTDSERSRQKDRGRET